MNKLFLFALLPMLTSMTAKAQTKVSINGTVPATTKYVLLKNVANNNRLDSVIVKDGKFSYTGVLPEGTFIDISAGANTMTSPSIIIIGDATPVKTNLITMEIEGSDANKKFAVYQKQLADVSMKMNSLYDKFKKAQTPAEKKAIQNEAGPLQEQVFETSQKAIRENPDNLIPAYFISDLAMDMTYDELKSALNESHPYAHHALADEAWKVLKQKEIRKPGKTFIDLEEADTTGVNHKLSEYIGKGNYIMIDFWASWCGPCRAEMPNVVANYKKYHSKGFEIIGLSFDQKAPAWKAAIKRLGMEWIQLSDLKGWDTIASSTYGIKSIPSSILFDPQGKIVATDLRGEDLGNKLKEIYGF